jgi:hypothetical protein
MKEDDEYNQSNQHNSSGIRKKTSDLSSLKNSKQLNDDTNSMSKTN